MSSRDYIQALDQIIVQENLPAINSNPQASTIFERAKQNLFDRWGVDRDGRIPVEFENLNGVIIQKNNRLDMSMNSQLASELIRIGGDEPDIIELANTFKKFSQAGARVDSQFKKEFADEFQRLDQGNSYSWKECWLIATKSSLSVAHKQLCDKANASVEKSYFKNNPIDYVVPIDSFSPSFQVNSNDSSSIFWSDDNPGLNSTSDEISICLNEVNSTQRDSSQDCPGQKGALEYFNDQLSTARYTEEHIEFKYFDFLRVEAIKNLMLNFTNALGRYPDREDIRDCEKSFSPSLDNIYEVDAEKFNPRIRENIREHGLIAARNKEMAQKLIILSQKIRTLFNVPKNVCTFVASLEEYVCHESPIWANNKNEFERLNNILIQYLNEFPLLGSKIDFSQQVFTQVLDPENGLNQILISTNEEIIKQRNSVIENNIISSINRFCGSKSSDIKNIDLMEMKPLRDSVIRDFPGHDFASLDACLEHHFEQKKQYETTLRSTYSIGCAGLSIAAGALTFYSGGFGGLALSVGLGCFGIESSNVYQDYIEARNFEETIQTCMVSSPDLITDDSNKLCDNASWQAARRRFEEAVENLELQVLLSPFEIIPSMHDLRMLLKNRRQVQKLLGARDILVNNIEQTANLSDVARLRNELDEVTGNLQEIGVTSDDLRAFYQEKALRESNLLNTPMTDVKLIETPVTDFNFIETPITGHGDLDTPFTDVPNYRTPVTDVPNYNTPITGSADLSTPVTGSVDLSTPVTGVQVEPPFRSREFEGGFVNGRQLIGDLEIQLKRRMSGLLPEQIKRLEELPRASLSYLNTLFELGGDFSTMAKKLMAKTLRGTRSLEYLDQDSLNQLLADLIFLQKNNPEVAKKFARYLSGPNVTNHTLNKFLRNCLRKNNCDSLISSLETRLNSGTMSREELSLLNHSPGPYMEYYLPLQEGEPLGSFIGKGSYGAVFCRGHSSECNEVIKIPLDYHQSFIFDYERSFAEIFINNGDRAAKITSPKSQVVMIKDYVPGEEAIDILASNRLYSQTQENDLVSFFSDMKNARAQSKDILKADIKANNIKWDTNKEKWVFVDTGARPIPRDMFQNPDHFYDTFGREFFFPSYLGQSSDELIKRRRQWKRVCQRMIKLIEESIRSNFEIACDRSD